ncbi:class I adenylate-forming enzyme family protein [Dactylosporangium darangshiense]|uniref:AMP-dependent synthetase/ligase domain-containing protein n=1 Tax=Dactylosporangium darangshiense TaxID=579108 RepID=A0ABP8CT97_9ACTN
MSAAIALSSATQAIADRFGQLAKDDANRIAVYDRDRAVTFGQLWTLAYRRVAAMPPAARIVPIVAQPTVSTIVEALAVWLCDAVPLPIPLGTRAKALDEVIGHSACAAHWCRPWRAHLHTAYGGRHIWVAGGESPTTPRVRDAMGLSAGGTALIAAPLHAAAIFEIVIRQLLAAGTVVLEPDFHPDSWLHTAAETRAGWAVLAPGQIKALLHDREQPPGRLGVATRALRRVVVPADVAGTVGHLTKFAAAADVTVTSWYHAPAYDGAIATIGAVPAALTALPGMRFRTVDPAGRPTPPGVAGLIEATSTGCTAVAHRADQPCPPPQAWRTSGDIGTLTSNDSLTVHRIEPTEHYLSPTGQRLRGSVLRRVAAAHPDVAAVTVHVVPDEHGRARAQLRVWPRPDARQPLNPGGVAAHCAAHSAPMAADHILIANARPPVGSP